MEKVMPNKYFKLKALQIMYKQNPIKFAALGGFLGGVGIFSYAGLQAFQIGGPLLTTQYVIGGAAFGASVAYLWPKLKLYTINKQISNMEKQKAERQQAQEQA